MATTTQAADHWERLINALVQLSYGIPAGTRRLLHDRFEKLCAYLCTPFSATDLIAWDFRNPIDRGPKVYVISATPTLPVAADEHRVALQDIVQSRPLANRLGMKGPISLLAAQLGMDGADLDQIFERRMGHQQRRSFEQLHVLVDIELISMPGGRTMSFAPLGPNKKCTMYLDEVAKQLGWKDKRAKEMLRMLEINDPDRTIEAGRWKYHIELAP